MSEEEKTRRETIEHAYDYQIALTEESDRAAAILAAAYFENWLRETIMKRFVEKMTNYLGLISMTRHDRRIGEDEICGH